MTSCRRVVVTGIGLASPLGGDAERVFDQLMNGHSAIQRVSLDRNGRTITLPAAIVGEPLPAIAPRQLAPVLDRVSELALCAAARAIADASLAMPSPDTGRIGTSVGTCMGGIISTETAYDNLFTGKSDRVPPFTLVRTMYNAPASHIAATWDLGGPSMTYSTTCSSSTIAIGEAMRTIRHGYADVMIAGGTEALLAWGSVKAWQALRILAPECPTDVAASCRPFSRDRAGTAIGEGAVFVILEALEHALARGARVRAELAGYGTTTDRAHMTQPSIEGQAATIVAALRDASLAPDAIDYVNAHGTATALNDVTETQAIKAAFGAHASRLAISSTKSMHGHMIGATGAMELAILVFALEKQQVPPTAHLVDPDPECNLDYVPVVGRDRPVTAAMSTSFAFGGTSGALVVTRPDRSKDRRIARP